MSPQEASGFICLKSPVVPWFLTIMLRGRLSQEFKMPIWLSAWVPWYFSGQTSCRWKQNFVLQCVACSSRYIANTTHITYSRAHKKIHKQTWQVPSLHRRPPHQIFLFSVEAARPRGCRSSYHLRKAGERKHVDLPFPSWQVERSARKFRKHFPLIRYLLRSLILLYLKWELAGVILRIRHARGFSEGGTLDSFPSYILRGCHENDSLVTTDQILSVCLSFIFREPGRRGKERKKAAARPSLWKQEKWQRSCSGSLSSRERSSGHLAAIFSSHEKRAVEAMKKVLTATITKYIIPKEQTAAAIFTNYLQHLTI